MDGRQFIVYLTSPEKKNKNFLSVHKSFIFSKKMFSFSTWKNSNEQSIFQRAIFGEESRQVRQIAELFGSQQSVGVNHVHAEVTLQRLLHVDVFHVPRVVRLIGAVGDVDEIT